jgi:hypothetical protein
MASQDDINNTNVIFAGLTGTLILVVFILAMSVLVFHQMNQQAAADAEAVQSPELASLLETQRDILEGKAADADHKMHIPIERAMQMVVAELAAGPAAAVGPHAEETSHGK